MLLSAIATRILQCLFFSESCEFLPSLGVGHDLVILKLYFQFFPPGCAKYKKKDYMNKIYFSSQEL